LHTGSDLKIFLTWCASQDLESLCAGRVDVERYVRWLQEVRCYQPSTVSRRLSIVVGFYRVCVIDQVLPYAPADYVRRPPVPAESPTLGLGHLQFEALISTARLSQNINDLTVSRVSWNFGDDPCELYAAVPTVSAGAAVSGWACRYSAKTSWGICL
jgi:integrase/recombinase XerD